MPGDEVRMTLEEHIEELRKCLLRALIGVAVGMVVCLFFGKHLFAVLTWPLSLATGGLPPRLHYLAPPEPFSTYFRVCLIAGAILSSPFGLYQLWRFIAAGLYERERRAVRRYLAPSIFLFALGVVFFFVVVAPLVVRFFLVFARDYFPQPPDWGVEWFRQRVGSEGQAATTRQVDSGSFVQPMLRISEYVSFVALLSLVFGLAFQTPLVVMFLAGSGLVKIEAMRSFRRYVFIVILILSAFITPPDWVSMLALSLPMYLLYEVGLLAAGVRARRR